MFVINVFFVLGNEKVFSLICAFLPVVVLL